MQLKRSKLLNFLVVWSIETSFGWKLVSARSVFRSLTTSADIYCRGPLLEAVQKAELFHDSKQFVDMPMRQSAAATLEAFEQLGSLTSNVEILSKFIGEMFDPPRDELEIADLTDWSPNPTLLSTIRDPNYQGWAADLNEIWKKLGRRVKPEVKLYPEKFSLIYVPHPFVIPGGRFREIYYWDSYWIAKGLLACGMTLTTKGMIQNLAYLAQKFGMIPNGSRIYYLNRSQPPLFIPMVKEYYDATSDLEFIKTLLPTLETEFHFWLNNRQFILERSDKPKIRYFQYRVNSTEPRPESWREDMKTVDGANSTDEKRRIWSEIASAAESGWDFSSRWLAHEGPTAFELQSSRTSKVVPVDLNAFMAMSAKSLSQLFNAAGDVENAEIYQRHFYEIKAAIRQLHWNETDGVWYDYDLQTHSHINKFYVSNLTPLVADCHLDIHEAKRVYKYLKTSEALDKFPYGIPTSFVNSTQQWDFTNAWPPAVHLVIEGLRLTGDPELLAGAEKIASRWVQTNYVGYVVTRSMFEKYDVSGATNFGGTGGEYAVQTGFGWTNGVVLDLLAKLPNISYSIA